MINISMKSDVELRTKENYKLKKWDSGLHTKFKIK